MAPAWGSKKTSLQAVIFYNCAELLCIVQDPVRQSALDLSTKLLTLPTVTTVQTQSKALLSSLFTSRAAFHWHKVFHQQQRQQ